MFVCTYISSRYFFYIHLYISASLNHNTIGLSSHLINHSTISMALDQVLNQIMVIDIFALSEQKISNDQISVCVVANFTAATTCLICNWLVQWAPHGSNIIG